MLVIVQFVTNVYDRDKERFPLIAESIRGIESPGIPCGHDVNRDTLRARCERRFICFFFDYVIGSDRKLSHNWESHLQNINILFVNR